jgi:hypothetical protein
MMPKIKYRFSFILSSSLRIKTIAQLKLLVKLSPDKPDKQGPQRYRNQRKGQAHLDEFAEFYLIAVLAQNSYSNHVTGGADGRNIAA